MLVKIINCCDSNYWYNNHIGEIFDVYDYNQNKNYVVKNLNRKNDIYFINLLDAIEIDRRKKINKIFDRMKNNI